MAKGENKRKLPRFGVKIYGHKSHSSGGRMIRILAKRGFFEFNNDIMQIITSKNKRICK